MVAAVRIVLHVLVYRLQRLEMANLMAAASLMLALGTSLPDFCVRFLFLLFLNVLVYTNNDLLDVDRDLAAGRDRAGCQFLKEHRREAWGAQLGLGMILLGLALWWDLHLLVAGALGLGICFAYSAWFKARPFVDILAMTFWGVAMPLAAISWEEALGWVLLIQLGLYSAVFETIQVLRDRPVDAAMGLRTTAVVLGDRNTERLGRGLMGMAALYGVLLLNQWVGLIAFLALVLPRRPEKTTAYWMRVRGVFGFTWLGILIWIFLTGSASGLLGPLLGWPM